MWCVCGKIRMPNINVLDVNYSEKNVIFVYCNSINIPISFIFHRIDIINLPYDLI